ncbi:hypothetical protein CEXT_402861 [Caerostris extrusa]|uniref:Uncharacterized protein n=1 Tax=Caerostris extrusa TaxID=172846 RepID=A0AAV4QTS8_CAEEX|nr:hypothetical protein CEXT_402861 [Caerostris extrusa]
MTTRQSRADHTKPSAPVKPLRDTNKLSDLLLQYLVQAIDLDGVVSVIMVAVLVTHRYQSSALIRGRYSLVSIKCIYTHWIESFTHWYQSDALIPIGSRALLIGNHSMRRYLWIEDGWIYSLSTHWYQPNTLIRIGSSCVTH